MVSEPHKLLWYKSFPFYNRVHGETSVNISLQDGINRAAAPAVTGIAEVGQIVVTENGVSGVGISDDSVSSCWKQVGGPIQADAE